MANDKFLSKLPIRSVRDILARLQEYTHSRSDDKNYIRPEITVIVNGNEIRGLFYKLGMDKDQEILLLYVNAPAMESVIYVPVYNIELLAINNAEAIAHIISFGEIARPLKEEPIGRVVVEKTLASVTAKINAETGGNLKIAYTDGHENHTHFANAVDIINALYAAVREMIADEFAKKAIAKISQINISDSDKKIATVKKSGTEITIERNLADSLEFTLKNNIISGLNNVL